MRTSTKRFSLGLAASAAVIIALAAAPKPADAGQEPFIGELMLVPYTFCPRNYAEADGRLIAINQNQALFSLLGTNYGGDGRTTFALPDLRGRVPLGFGQGPGLTDVTLGQKSGAETATLTVNQMPSHTHAAITTVTVDATLRGSAAAATTAVPGGNVLANTERNNTYHAGPADADMGGSAVTASGTGATTVANAGGGQPFGIRPPYLGLRWCIALQGIFPSRN